MLGPMRGLIIFFSVQHEVEVTRASFLSVYIYGLIGLTLAQGHELHRLNKKQVFQIAS